MARKRIEGDPNLVMSESGVLTRRFSDDRGTPELQRHGEVYATTTNEGRETRKVNKTASLLDRLWNKKPIPDISRPAYNAGRHFEVVYYNARINPSATISLEGLGGGRRADLAEATYMARERLAGAVVALGGFASPVSGVVWHCIGNGLTLKEWCLRASSPNNPKEAKGMLVAGLNVLAGHWSIGDGLDEG